MKRMGMIYDAGLINECDFKPFKELRKTVRNIRTHSE